MMMRGTIALAMMAVASTGCGDKAQTAGTTKKADAKAWELAQSNHVAEGWKGGDQAAWEKQLRVRAQGQDEYSRSAATAPAAAPKAP
jgi:hypothetical protein